MVKPTVQQQISISNLMFTPFVCMADQETELADSHNHEGQLWPLTCDYIFVGFGKQREKEERKQTVRKNSSKKNTRHKRRLTGMR